MLDRQSLEQTIRLAQKGDLCARDELIKNHRDFIARISSRACKRPLTWDNDELSVALIAFNEAVDKFSPDEGAAFQTFAQRVIRNRLVDYFRKESKHRHLSLSPMDPDDEELSRFDLEHSNKQYQEAESQALFADVVEGYIETLNEYGVTLDDLVKVSPKHRDSRETLMNVALRLSSEASLLESLKRNKLLPIKELELLTGVKRRVLEKGRKYLIALVLIITDHRFYPLKSFTMIPEISFGEKVPLQ
jgi:RNA polymerase sigma factor